MNAFEKMIQKTATPPSRKRARNVVIVDAKDLKLGKNVHLRPVFFGEKRKIVSIRAYAGKSNHTVAIRFHGCGRVPQGWGVDVSEYGRTYITMQLDDPEEVSALENLQKDIVAHAHSLCGTADSWWKGKKQPTKTQIEDAFAPIYKAGKAKDEKDESKGFWPPSIKCTIPLNARGELDRAAFYDHGNNIMSHHEAAGSTTDVCIVEIPGLYFQGAKWNFGLGPKTCFVWKQLTPPSSNPEGELEEGDDMNYLDLILGEGEATLLGKRSALTPPASTLDSDSSKTAKKVKK